MIYSFTLKKLSLQILQMTAEYVWTVKILTELLIILRKECETAINWFKTNKMIVTQRDFNQ